jgi:elongation factor P
MELGSNEIRKGAVILHNNHPALVLSHALHKTGRGGNVNKTKVKDLITGSIVPVTFMGNESAEVVEVINKNIQFVYNDDEVATFMDPQSFEQVVVKIENIPGETSYLKEGELYQGMFYEGEVISVMIPKKMNFEVTQAADAVKGDSANNPTKKVTLETGLTVDVPLFIKQGETISVNTEENSYSGRVN